MSGEGNFDGAPLPASHGDSHGAPLPDGSASAALAVAGLAVGSDTGFTEDRRTDVVSSAGKKSTVELGAGLQPFDDGQGANFSEGSSAGEAAVESEQTLLVGAGLAVGEVREASALQRPPIRPVGHTSAATAATALILVTVAQLAWFGFTGYYFLDLSRHDWVEQLNPYDDENIAALGERGWILELDIPEIADVKQEYQAALTRRTRFEEFERDRRWMVPALIGGYWLELIVFALWQLRVHRNVAALGAVGIRHDPLTSLVWWIVPIVNWWLPLSVMQEIWRGSDPSVPVGDGQAWRLKRASALAGAWRAVALMAKLTFGFCLFMVALRLYSVANPPLLLVVASALMIVAGVLQIALVRRLGARQESLYRKRMKAAENAVAAELPVVEAQVLDDE